MLQGSFTFHKAGKGSKDCQAVYNHRHHACNDKSHLRKKTQNQSVWSLELCAAHMSETHCFLHLITFSSSDMEGNPSQSLSPHMSGNEHQ